MIEGKTLLVTGGCGFIGSHLVQRALDLGATAVVVVDSLRYGSRANLGASDPRVSVVEHTLGTDPTAALGPHLEPADFLVHLAAEKHNQSKETPRAVLDANVVGTHELFQLASDRGVRRAVFSSSLYAYGRMSGPAMHEESAPQPRTIYGISKLAGEHLLHLVASQGEMSGACLRYFFVYGPRQLAGLGYKSVIVKNFERIARGEAPIVFGDGEQALDYTYVDDVVDATLMALAPTSLPEVLNVGSGEALSVNALTAAMLEVAGSTLAPEFGPADWTHGTRRVGDVRQIREHLGWTAKTPLREGLARTYAWVRDRAERTP